MEWKEGRRKQEAGRKVLDALRLLETGFFSGFFSECAGSNEVFL
jgi:hypothetical protein